MYILPFTYTLALFVLSPELYNKYTKISKHWLNFGSHCMCLCTTLQCVLLDLLYVTCITAPSSVVLSLVHQVCIFCSLAIYLGSQSSHWLASSLYFCFLFPLSLCFMLLVFLVASSCISQPLGVWEFLGSHSSAMLSWGGLFHLSFADFSSWCHILS